ncbi:type II toxin-antitoxin system YoeB family toxin [Parabacteroides distasonis]|nr:type II toxin-antitoxin system YoeB family toxin [Parabacteroides distasonis]
MYEIEYSEESIKELLKLREHPYTGTGHPHQLRYLNGIWSRKLDKKNRLLYTINDTTSVFESISPKRNRNRNFRF